MLAARIRNATPGPDWGDWFFRKASVADGVVDQLGVHGIDLVAAPARPHPRRVGARWRTPRCRDAGCATGTIVDVENADNATAIYVLDDGALVTHEMSMIEVAGCDRFRLEIYGEKGTLWLRTERGLLAHRARRALRRRLARAALPERAVRASGSTRRGWRASPARRRGCAPRAMRCAACASSRP